MKPGPNYEPSNEPPDPTAFAVVLAAFGLVCLVLLACLAFAHG